MNDAERDILVRGVAAAKAGSLDEARFYLEKFLRMEPPVEDRPTAWRYLAEISTDPAVKRDYTARILAIDPTDGLARRALALLDGRLVPADIVDPDRVAAAAPGIAAAPTERLTCPQCGSGRLVASGDGRRLVCEHCGHAEPIPGATAASPVGEHDFAATMWTARGHRTPLQTMALVCGGCGASFLAPPDTRSLTCPFCGSTHSTAETAPRELIVPDAVVPFAAAGADLPDVVNSAAGGDPPSAPVAVYLPVWMFTFAGDVQWTGFEQERRGWRGDESSRVPVSGTYTVIEQAALVCGTPRLPDAFSGAVDEFDVSILVPYDPRQLAGHPVAAYQITLDEASIAARRKALDALRPVVKDEVTEDHPSLSGLEMTFGRLGADAFRLLLFPFWIAQAGPSGQRRLLFVNGQSGAVVTAGRRPGFLSRMTGWLRGGS